MAIDKPIIRNLHPVYQEGSNVNVIANSIINQFNTLTEEISNLKKEIQLSTATGEYLDDIGKLFNITRAPGESDEEFRARIKSFWPGYSGGGSINDLKSTISKMTGIPESSITITELGPMKILIQSYIGPNFSLIDVVKEVVWNVKAAGVYPFFDIKSLLNDKFNITDTIAINVTNKLYWDHSEWGVGTW